MQFNLLSTLSLVDEIHRIVHVGFNNVHQAGVLFELPLPVVYHLHAVRGELGRKSQFQQLGTRGQLGDEPFLYLRVLSRNLATSNLNALTGEPLLAASGRYDLTEQVCRIVLERFVVLLARYIHNILAGIVMGSTAPIQMDGHEVVTRLQDKVIDLDLQLVIIGDIHSSLLCRTVGLDFLAITLLVYEGKGCLVDIEEGTDLPCPNAFISCLLLWGKRLVGLTADLFLSIALADILVPVVPVERYAFLLGLHGLTTFLRFAEKGIVIGLIAMLVAMDGQGQRIEG